MRRFIANFLAATVVCGYAQASTFSTDLSDLWYNAPAESEAGWGITVNQQDSILFLTMFVYGNGGQATWFVASNASYAGGGNSLVFSGPLYALTGAPFSAPWNPAVLSLRQVGTITFTANSVTTGTLSYTVDGITVNKNVVR